MTSSDEDRSLEQLRSALSDRYAIEAEIGHGGMAHVYRARDLKHDRTVALKVLRPEVAVAIGADRFHREVEFEARLNHPNILALFDSGQAGANLYFAMPLAEGSLAERLKREGPLALEEALSITREVGEGLQHAHQKGIVHRDIKPANILVSSGHAMIADFGIALAVADADTKAMTESGIVLGTPEYMSPEQAETSKVDQRSDIYSLACVLFEMLAGEPPFTGPTSRVVIAKHCSEPPPSLEVARPGVPPNVVAAIEAALAKVPADRYQTVDDFLAALERPDVASPAEIAARKRRRRKRFALTGVLAAAAGITYWAARSDTVVLSPDKVAVFPLSTQGLAPGEAGVGLGVAYLIEAALEHARPLRFVDVAGRLDELQLASPEQISFAEAREISRRERAALYLRGAVQGHADSTTVILRVYDVRGDSMLEQQSVTGPAEVPLHHLGIDAVTALLPALIDAPQEVDLAALRDRSPAAIALWMQGEREYRNSNFAPALALYGRALEVDSALALAAVKGGQAASWIHDRDQGRSLVALALSQDSLLPERYQRLARGLAGYFSGEANAAVRWLQDARNLDPEWSEAATALGEVYYHLLPSAWPLDSLAEAAFQSAASTDSTFSPPLFHLTELAIRRGDEERSDRLLRRYRAVEPEPMLVQHLELMRDCAFAPSAVDWDVQARVDPTTVFRAAKSLSVAGLQVDCAAAAFRALLGSASASDGERWAAFLGLQGLLVSTGRHSDATALVDSVVASGKGVARSLHVLNVLAGSPFEEDAVELEGYARETFGAEYERLTATEPLWVLAAWQQHRGDHRALQLIERAVASATAGNGSRRDSLRAYAVAAQLTLSSGDTTGAIDRLRALPSGSGAELAWGFSDGLPAERLLLARLLLASGRYEESLAAATVFDHPQPIMFLQFVPLSLSLRYEAAMALGDSDSADRFRERLLRLDRADLVDAVHVQHGGV